MTCISASIMRKPFFAMTDIPLARELPRAPILEDRGGAGDTRRAGASTAGLLVAVAALYPALAVIDPLAIGHRAELGVGARAARCGAPACRIRRGRKRAAEARSDFDDDPAAGHAACAERGRVCV